MNALRVAQKNHSEQLEKQKNDQESSSFKNMSDTNSPPLEAQLSGGQPKFKLEEGGIVNGDILPPFPKHSPSHAAPSLIRPMLGVHTGPSLLPVGSVPSNSDSRRSSLKSPVQIKQEPAIGGGLKPLIFSSISAGTPTATIPTYSSHPPNIPLIRTDFKEDSGTPTPMSHIYPYEQKFYGYIPIGIYHQNGETRVSLPSVLLSTPHHVPLMPGNARSTAEKYSPSTGSVLTTSSATHPLITLAQPQLFSQMSSPSYHGLSHQGPTRLPPMMQQLNSAIHGIPSELGLSSASAVNSANLPPVMTMGEAKLVSTPPQYSLAQPSMIVAYAPTPIYFSQPQAMPTTFGAGGPRPPVSYSSHLIADTSYEGAITLPPVKNNFASSFLLPPVRAKDKVGLLTQTTK